MKELQNLLKQKNEWQVLFNSPLYEIKTPKGRKALADIIECDLSPENLTCDGGARYPAFMRKRFADLTKAKAQLRSIK